MTYRFTWVALAMACAGLAVAQEPPKPQDLTLSGTVTDAAGKPVAGATVGQSWQLEAGRWTASRHATTDADGKFTLSSRVFPGRTYSLCAFDAEQARGACRAYTADEAQTPLTLQLAPLATVEGRLVCKALARVPAGGHANVSLAKPFQHLVGHEIGADGAFRFRLPTGAYDLRFYLGLDFQGTSRKLTVPDTGVATDLGEIDVAPSVIAQHYGKAPPAWQGSDARNLPDALAAKGGAIQPADFAGKWVLVEFWGFW